MLLVYFLLRTFESTELELSFDIKNEKPKKNLARFSTVHKTTSCQSFRLTGHFFYSSSFTVPCLACYARFHGYSALTKGREIRPRPVYGKLPDNLA